jgi:methyltransferase
VSPLYWILAFVAVQRLAELLYAQRNTRALLARGAREIAPEQYPFFIALHAAWIVAMLVFIPKAAAPNWGLVAIYFALQFARVWAIASLGEFWTTRIITLPNAPLVRRGPYRLMRHPNYAIVVLEIAILPSAFGAYAIAAVFSALNAALLVWRIRTENDALSSRRQSLDRA